MARLCRSRRHATVVPLHVLQHCRPASRPVRSDRCRRCKDPGWPPAPPRPTRQVQRQPLTLGGCHQASRVPQVRLVGAQDPVEAVEISGVQLARTQAADVHAVPGHTLGLEPVKSHWARPIDTPPYYGYPLRPGITSPTWAAHRRTAAVHSLDGPARTCSSPANDGGQCARQGYTAGVGMSIGTASAASPDPHMPVAGAGRIHLHAPRQRRSVQACAERTFGHRRTADVAEADDQQPHRAASVCSSASARSRSSGVSMPGGNGSGEIATLIG